MVTFESDAYVVRVHTPIPVEEWSYTYRALLVLIGNIRDSEDVPDDMRYVTDLLQALLPGIDDIKQSLPGSTTGA